MVRRTLDIIGGGGRSIRNELTSWEDYPRHGVVLLPGQRYTCDMPAFYYLEEMALDVGAAVLRLAPAYNEDERFRRWPLDPTQRDWLQIDIAASIAALIAVHDVPRVTVVAKSLTTLGLAGVDWTGPTGTDRAVHLVWLTPLLREAEVVNRLMTSTVPSLVAMGTADHHYDQGVIDQLATRSAVSVAIVEGADHSFDQRGNIDQSLTNIDQVVEAVRRFAFA